MMIKVTNKKHDHLPMSIFVYMRNDGNLIKFKFKMGI